MFFCRQDTESPFGPGERDEGNGARGPCALLFMHSELMGDVTHPLVAMLEALSSWATVAVNSCHVSEHTAWSQ